MSPLMAPLLLPPALQDRTQYSRQGSTEAQIRQLRHEDQGDHVSLLVCCLATANAAALRCAGA